MTKSSVSTEITNVFTIEYGYFTIMLLEQLAMDPLDSIKPAILSSAVNWEQTHKAFI